MSKLVRLSPDKTKGVVQEDTVFSVLNFDLRTVELTSETSPEGDWHTPTTEERIEMLPLVAAMDSARRSRKAQSQPRDSSGRWVSAGANVRWNSNGEDWAGTVMAIKDGKAIVQVKHEDGTESQTTLMPNTLRVLASKARLSSAKKKSFQDEKNNTEEFINKNKRELSEAAKQGGAQIDREDGYSIDAVDRDGDGKVNEKEKQQSEAERKNGSPNPNPNPNPNYNGTVGLKNKEGKEGKGDTSNALMYQLYAPNGKSLGIFDGAAGGEGSIDSIISSDKASSEGVEKVAVNSDVVIVSSTSPLFTVPKNVQESVRNFITKHGESLSDEVLLSASKLCSGEQITYDDLEYARDYYENLDLYGGPMGGKWISKIDQQTVDPTPAHNFLDSVYSYYVYGDSNSEFVGLIAVDFLKGKVLGWTGTEFGLELGPIENFDAEIIEYVDEYTAEEVSKLLSGSGSFSLMDIFPDERNLFALAHSEIDFQLLDEVAQLAYNPGERSLDAQKQARDGGGKFGKVDPPKEEELSVDESTKYFAIVDEVDTTAVMDIVAITNNNGTPQLFKRLMNQWVPDEDLLQDIQGSTPPPVSLLTTPEAVKEVLSQVDAYDSGKDDSGAVTASGFSLPDGSLSIITHNDLYVAVYSVTETPTTEGILHTVKRAKALNRLDVVPEDWRIFAANRTETQSLYGEFGEVLTASVAPVEMSNLERLESYWLNNEKIDWSSEYAVEYASGMLSKYLDNSHAKAFATILKNKAGNP